MSRPNFASQIAICLILLLPAAADAAKPAVWIKVRSPNFIVVTDGSEKQARKVAYQFEMFRSVLRSSSNTKGTETDPPVTIIAAKDQESMKALEPEVNLAKGSAHLAGLFLDGPERKYVLLQLDTSVDLDASEPFEAIYHEYVHYYTRRLIPFLPLWLTEGLAEFYGNTRLEGKFALVGTPSKINLEILQSSPILPLSTLYAVNASSPYYHEENKASVFYAESWALTHYLLTKDWTQKTDHVRQFMIQLQKNVSPEIAAKTTLGDPQALQDALDLYVHRLSYTVARVAIPAKIDANDFTRDPFSEAESLTERGKMLVLVRRYDDAQRTFDQAIKADPKLAGGYEGMGFLYSAQTKYDDANKWFSQAVELNSEGTLANFLYATNLFKTQLDKETADKAEKSLRTAIRGDANFAPAYDALAYLLLATSRGPEEAQRLCLQAITLEPGNIQYRLRMANVLIKLNQLDNAVRVASLARSMARTIGEENQADYVLENVRRMQEYSKNNAESSSGVAEVREPGQIEPPSASSDHASGADEDRAGDGPGPPALRHRDPGANPQMPPPSPQRPELLKQEASAEGTVTASTCPNLQSLELTLVAKAKTLHFFSDNYYKVAFSALNFTPQGIMNPCSDLKGMHARVTYYPAKGAPDQGQLVEVRVAR